MVKLEVKDNNLIGNLGFLRVKMHGMPVSSEEISSSLQSPGSPAKERITRPWHWTW